MLLGCRKSQDIMLCYEILYIAVIYVVILFGRLCYVLPLFVSYNVFGCHILAVSYVISFMSF